MTYDFSFSILRNSSFGGFTSKFEFFSQINLKNFRRISMDFLQEKIQKIRCEKRSSDSG